MSSPTHDLPDVIRADMEYIASKIGSAGASQVASIACSPLWLRPLSRPRRQLSQSESLSQGCWLNASRPTMAMR